MRLHYYAFVIITAKKMIIYSWDCYRAVRKNHLAFMSIIVYSHMSI